MLTQNVDQIVSMYLNKQKSAKLQVSKAKNSLMMQAIMNSSSMQQLSSLQVQSPDLALDELIAFECKAKIIQFKQVKNLNLSALIQLAKQCDLAGLATKINYKFRNVVLLHDFFQTPIVIAGVLNHLKAKKFNVFAPFLCSDLEAKQQDPLPNRVKAAIAAFVREKSDYVIIAQGFAAPLAQIIGQEDKRCKQIILINPQLSLKKVSINLDVQAKYNRETIDEIAPAQNKIKQNPSTVSQISNNNQLEMIDENEPTDEQQMMSGLEATDSISFSCQQFPLFQADTQGQFKKMAAAPTLPWMKAVPDGKPAQTEDPKESFSLQLTFVEVNSNSELGYIRAMDKIRGSVERQLNEPQSQFQQARFQDIKWQPAKAVRENMMQILFSVIGVAPFEYYKTIASNSDYYTTQMFQDSYYLQLILVNEPITITGKQLTCILISEFSPMVPPLQVLEELRFSGNVNMYFIPNSSHDGLGGYFWILDSLIESQ